MAGKRGNKAKVTTENGVHTFAFADGRTATVQLADFPESIHTRLAMHGAKQKLVDSYASTESVADAFDAFHDTFNMLRNGEWTSRVAAEPRVTLLAEALVNLTGKPMDYIKAHLDECNKQDKATYRADPEVVAEIARLELERAKAKAQAAKASAKSAKPGSALAELRS